MTSAAIERMHGRARSVRTRALVRGWSYRQRGAAAGVWFRLRRVLAAAREACVISEADASRLLSEGCRLEPCGLEVAPAKQLLFVDARRLTAIGSARAIPVGLGEEFLAARAVALIPFDDPTSE